MICIYIVRELVGSEGCAVGRGNSMCKNPEAVKYKSHAENLEEIQSGGATGGRRRKMRWERMTAHCNKIKNTQSTTQLLLLQDGLTLEGCLPASQTPPTWVIHVRHTDK